MKKARITGLVVVSCIMLLQIFAFTALGDAEQPIWNVGDKWEYKASMEIFDLSYDYHFTYEVSDLATFNLNGTDYDIYDIDVTADMTLRMPNIDEITVTMTGYDYILRDNLEGIKSKLSASYMGTETTVEVIYDPPMKQLDFPLTIGKSWDVTSRITIIQNINGEVTSSNWTISGTYTIMGLEIKTVEAGTFECHKIKSDDGLGTVTYSWYSPEVKNIVLGSDISTGSDLEIELTSFSEKEDGFDLFSMPYVLILLLIPIIIVVLVAGIALSSKRKKAAQAKALSPGLGATTPTSPLEPVAYAGAQQPTQQSRQLVASTPTSAPSRPPVAVATPRIQPQPQQYVAPAPQRPAPPTLREHPCPSCRRQLSFIQQYNRWYCHYCKKYQ